MRIAPGRKTVLLSAVATAAVLVFAALALRGRVLEWWWVRKLEQGSDMERRLAAERLVEMKSHRAIPVVAKLLEERHMLKGSMPDGHDDWSAHCSHIEAVQFLWDATQDLGAEALAAVLRVMGKGPKWEPYIDSHLSWEKAPALLLQCLESSEMEVVRGALELLEGWRLLEHVSLERLEKLLGHRDLQVRMTVARSLASHVREKGKWRRAALEILEDKTTPSDIREELQGSLFPLDPFFKSLGARLDRVSTAPGARFSRLLGLGLALLVEEAAGWAEAMRKARDEAGSLAQKLAGPVEDWLEEPYTALDRLGSLGPIAGPAVPQIAAIFRDTSLLIHLRCKAMEAWARIDPDSAELREACLRALEGESRCPMALRHDAAKVLGRYHPPTEEALVALGNTLEDPHFWVREEAARSLGSLGEPARSLAGKIRPLLADEHPSVQHAAAQALWRLEQNAREALPVIWEALREPKFGDDDFHVTHWCELIREMGLAAKETVPGLIPLLDRGFEPVSAAYEALGRLGPDAAEAIPALVALLGDPWRSDDSARALARIGKLAVRPLATVLGTGGLLARWRAVCVLEELGGDAVDAASALGKAAANDPDEDVRAKANAVLEGIQPVKDRA